MKVTGVLHTSILVSNLEKAEHFYGEILGLNKVERYAFNFAGAWYQIGDYQIHLMVDAQRKDTISNVEKWGRNPHIALMVESIEEAKQSLEVNGVSYQASASGRSSLFTKDPDGNIIELTQK